MPRPTPPQLFHYCCKHSATALALDPVLRSAAALRARGADSATERLVGSLHTAWLADVVWLTDLDWVSRTIDGFAERILGLDGVNLQCNRVEQRITITDTAEAVWWPTYRRTLTGDAAEFARQLEESPDVRPVHWWIHPGSVPVVSIEPTIRRGSDLSVR